MSDYGDALERIDVLAKNISYRLAVDDIAGIREAEEELAGVIQAAMAEPVTDEGKQARLASALQAAMHAAFFAGWGRGAAESRKVRAQSSGHSG